MRVGLPGGRHLVAQVWKAQVGRVPLLLLDSDVEDNEPAERDVTDRLYGGGSEHRLLQEMLLGIGGVRALRAYAALTGSPSPEVFHTNEGHAGFLGIERIRELTEDAGLDFDDGHRGRPRRRRVFTTHTPVPAGIDRFARDLIAQHFGGDNGCPGVPVDRVLALGAEDYEGGDPTCSTWPSWACGWRSVPTASPSCTARSPARCSPGCGPVSTPPRSRSATSPTACTLRPGSRPRSSTSARPRSG